MPSPNRDTAEESKARKQQTEEVPEETKKPGGNATTTNTTEANPNDPPLSKNQLKKRRRWERAMEVKKRRKQQEREAKNEKAKAEGRDLEKERAEQLKNREDGAGRRRRQEKWDTYKAPLIEKSFQVSIDCAFEDQMTAKEVNSLSNQIRYCYSNNRYNPHPCKLVVTSLSGQTLAHLQNVNGFEGWTNRAFSSSKNPLDEVFRDRLKDVVYLTSDSENTIEDLDDSKIYIIGGIVDRNRLQRAAITRAEELSLATAKLPLERHLQKMKATKVLTCNHVFDILLKYREHGKNWEKALLEVLPSRKDVAPLRAGNDDAADPKSLPNEEHKEDANLTPKEEGGS